MNISKEIGRYNLTINNGHLDRVTNTWFYQLIVDKFDYNDEWEDSNIFYIIGHRDDNAQEESLRHILVDTWLKFASEKDIDEVFSHKRNYQFKIIKPKLVMF